MAEIQFENEQEFARPAAYSTEPRGMAALIMKWGLAKDEKTAQYVLLGIAAVTIVLAFLLYTLISPSRGAVNPATPASENIIPQ